MAIACMHAMYLVSTRALRGPPRVISLVIVSADAILRVILSLRLSTPILAYPRNEDICMLAM